MPIFADVLSQTNTDTVVTTSAVLLELGNALSQASDRSRFLDIHDLVETGLIEGVFLTPEVYRNALTLFSERADKNWSLTDCISFIVMKSHGITDAATTDHHFEQAGFRVLLRKNKA